MERTRHEKNGQVLVILSLLLLSGCLESQQDTTSVDEKLDMIMAGEDYVDAGINRTDNQTDSVLYRYEELDLQNELKNFSDPVNNTIPIVIPDELTWAMFKEAPLKETGGMIDRAVLKHFGAKGWLIIICFMAVVITVCLLAGLVRVAGWTVLTLFLTVLVKFML